MENRKKIGRWLGAAFVFQFITSITSGVVFGGRLFDEGSIAATLQNIAAQPELLRANILMDMLTALGVTFLGAMLYLALRDTNEKLALTGFAFYAVEGVLLAASRGEAFKLLEISQAYVLEPSASLEMLAGLAVHSMDFVGMTLHMLVFSIGAMMLYFLLVQSRIVPRWLSIWGLAALVPVAVSSVLAVFGGELPMWVYGPYIPFELVIGLWLLVKSISED